MARPPLESSPNAVKTSEIISFRLPGTHVNRLKKKFEKPENSVIGVCSEDQLLRKISMDWIDGKLIYVSDADRRANPLLAEAV